MKTKLIDLESSKMENKLKPNNEIQLIETCENCIQDRELVEEIIKLCEYATELEAVIYDLENQIVELKQELYFIL